MPSIETLVEAPPRKRFCLCVPLLRFLGEGLNATLLELLSDAPDQTRRYNELLRLVAPTSKRTLTASLRRLERLGLVERRVFDCVPTRVEYSLTPCGCVFIEPLEWMEEWSANHPQEVASIQAE